MFGKLLTIIQLVLWASLIEARTLDILMPGIKPEKDDDYWCHSTYVGNDSYYITNFKAVHNPHLTHHMILFACEVPGSSKDKWHCGDMSEESGKICEGTPSILFAWAMEAPSFELPKDISFKVGKGTPFRFLVLQIHYKDMPSSDGSSNSADASGLIMDVKHEPTANLAGVYIMVSGGTVARKAKTLLYMQCQYFGQVPIHPFAFRVHAHGHGVLNKGQVYQQGEWHLIGQQSPQKPQTFYPVENKDLEIRPGDIVRGQCEMVNNENKDYPMGSTRKDEMCNYYIMYWVPKEYEEQIYDSELKQCYGEDRAVFRNDGEETNDYLRRFWPSYSDENLEEYDQLIDPISY